MGADSWRTREFQALPEEFWDQVSDMFGKIVVTKCLPHQLRLILHPLIPKPGSDVSLPLSQRALSLFTGIYTAWSTAMFRNAQPWYRSIMHLRVRGGIENQECLDELMPLALNIEDAPCKE
eukprot:6175105-Karenia_brevis.AAC.1